MADIPFLGMRGTGDWQTNQRPENWRQGLLKLYPNGGAPLTAILSMLSNESVDDPHFHWWTKELANQRAAVTGIYLNPSFATAYVMRGAANDTVYLRMAAADVDKFRDGHTVLMRSTIDPEVDVVGEIVDRRKAGAASYIAVTLREADDNSPRHDLSDCDVAYIIGNVNPEGSTAPDSIMYDPKEYSNYTQIFRTTLEHTRTAMKTKLRTGEQVKQAKAEALELHGMEMEKSFIVGIPWQGIGSNGKPKRMTCGIRGFLSTNKFNFPLEGGTWLADGEDWLDEKFEQLFRFGKDTRLLLCGNSALLGINRLIKARGGSAWEMTKMSAAYGIKVIEWVTPFGTVYLKTHPLFNYEPTLRNAMLAVSTENLTYRYIDDTMYEPKLQQNDLDGEKSGYLTEAGLELHFEQTFGWFDGIGMNNYATTDTTPAPTTLATTVPPTTFASTLASTVASTAAPTTLAPTTVAATTIVTTVAATTLATTAAPTTTATTGA